MVAETVRKMPTGPTYLGSWETKGHNFTVKNNIKVTADTQDFGFRR